MGAFGVALFSDDTASDVRDDFKTLIGDGLDAKEATERLLREWQSTVDDADEGPVFWLALAATQWNLGRLLPQVLEHALRVIDSGQNLDSWRDSPELKKRQKMLAALRVKLASQPPAAKRVPKKFRSSTDWTVGSVHAYELRSKAFCLFRVIGFHSDKGGRSPVVELLDWVGDVLPTAEVIEKLRVRVHYRPKGHSISQFLLGAASRIDTPGNRIRTLDVMSKPSQKAGGYSVFLWRRVDQDLLEKFGIGGDVV